MATRTKRKERITLARQKQILKAALSVFSSEGYGQSTVADVAQAAGVGVGTIYNYYKDKRDLLISLIFQMMVTESLVSILDRMSSSGGADDMQSLLEERLEFGFDNAQALLAIMPEIQRDPGLRRRFVQQLIQPLMGRLEEYIRRQVRKGAFNKVDERVVARLMVGMIIGSMILYRLELRDSPFKKTQARQLAAELRNLFLEGLARR